MVAQTDDDITEWLPVEQRISNAINELRRVVAHTTIRDAINADGTLTGAGFVIHGAAILAERSRLWLHNAYYILRDSARIPDPADIEDLTTKGFIQISDAWRFFTESNIANFAAWAAVNGRNEARIGVRWTGHGTIRASAVNSFGELIASATVGIPDTEWDAEFEGMLWGKPAPVEPVAPVANGGGLKFWCN